MLPFALVIFLVTTPALAGKVDCTAKNLNRQKAITATAQKNLDSASLKLHQVLQNSDALAFNFSLELLKNFQERGNSYPTELAPELKQLEKAASFYRKKPKEEQKKQIIAIYYLLFSKILSIKSSDRALVDRLQQDQEKIKLSRNEMFLAMDLKAQALKAFYRESDALRKIVIPCEGNGGGRPTLF